jgi:hypothetical protein
MPHIAMISFKWVAADLAITSGFHCLIELARRSEICKKEEK